MILMSNFFLPIFYFYSDFYAGQVLWLSPCDCMVMFLYFYINLCMQIFPNCMFLMCGIKEIKLFTQLKCILLLAFYFVIIVVINAEVTMH